MTGKYVKPTSLSWWASFVPLVAGLVLAAEPLHGWIGITETIDRASGGMTAAMLINVGALGIGLRGAL